VPATELVGAALDDPPAVPDEERVPRRHHRLGPRVEADHQLVLGGDTVVPDALDPVELVDARGGIDGERPQVQVSNVDVTAATVKVVDRPAGVAEPGEQVADRQKPFPLDINTGISRGTATAVLEDP